MKEMWAREDELKSKLDRAESTAARLTAELKEAHESNDALMAKIRSLSAHETCACSGDRPGDVCAHHSPQLTAALATAAQLAEALRNLMPHVDLELAPAPYRAARAALAAYDKGGGDE